MDAVGAHDQVGLDRPLVVQFGYYLRDLLHGDLGRALLTGLAALPVAATAAAAERKSKKRKPAKPKVQHVDVAIIGAGVFGAWTAWHLLRAGKTVRLFDAYGAGHVRASFRIQRALRPSGYRLAARRALRQQDQPRAAVCTVHDARAIPVLFSRVFRDGAGTHGPKD